MSGNGKMEVETPEKSLEVEEKKEPEMPTVIEISDFKKMVVDQDSGFATIKGIRIPFLGSDKAYQFKVTNPHDMPCPSRWGDVANDHAINEWVANHSPLKEEEKKQMIYDLEQDYKAKQELKEERTEEREAKNQLLKERILQEKRAALRASGRSGRRCGNARKATPLQREMLDRHKSIFKSNESPQVHDLRS